MAIFCERPWQIIFVRFYEGNMTKLNIRKEIFNDKFWYVALDHSKITLMPPALMHSQSRLGPGTTIIIYEL